MLTPPCRLHLLHLWVRHRGATLQSTTDSDSPVIIAENMIGCAMYELVCAVRKLGGTYIDGYRSALATTIW